jgi:PIN domain nuclease of toxin-antitoxin system
VGEVAGLLDTHALLWWLFDEPKLSVRARAFIADRGREIFVSSASAWEIATKHRLGKLPDAHVLVADMSGWIQKAGFSALPITIAHAQRAGRWTAEHRDPFDRMLAAQAEIENIELITNDPAFEHFGLRRLW